MEASVVNAWAAAGNLAGAVIVFSGVTSFPSVSFLLLAVFGPNIGARLISTALLLKKRPWLIRRAAPSRTAMGVLIRDGISFSATSVVVYFVEFVHRTSPGRVTPTSCRLASGLVPGAIRFTA